MKAEVRVLHPTHSELDIDTLLAALLIGMLAVMLTMLAHRVSPEGLTSAADNDEIPTVILEGP